MGINQNSKSSPTPTTLTHIYPFITRPRQNVHITSTMGKAFPVEVATVDPRSSRFMLTDEPVAGAARS